MKSPFVRLSESILWDLQKKAYTQFGIESWTRRGVPFHVTNNSLIAKQYAQVALPLFKQGAVTFLELGAGCGKFAYLFLSELLRLDVPESSIRYLLTDFSGKNISFCSQHPLMRPWIEKGVLHPLVYDPLTSQPLEFIPNFVIANYFFDTIPQDIFRWEQGKLFEGLVSVCTDELDGLEEPHQIPKLSLEYSYRPIERLPYFDSPELEAILNEYRQKQFRGIFLFPSSGLKALQNLCSLCAPSFSLLTADRGVYREVEVATEEPPLFNLHGTFSFPVNFHALAQFFIRRGGEAYFPNKSSSRFTAALFSSGKILEESAQFFQRQFFGAYTPKSSQWKDILAYLSEYNWDATLFFSYFEDLIRGVKGEPALFLEGALQIRDRFYPLAKEEALLLDRLGYYLEEMGKTQEAQKLFQMARTFDNMSQQTDFDVLQIGNAVVDLCTATKNLTVIPLHLASLQKVGMFDLILFFPHFLEKPAPFKIDFLEQIERQFPQLNQIVYTDETLDEFLSSAVTTCKNPKYIVDFLVSLEMKKQITPKQLAQTLDRLRIDSIDRAQIFPSDESGDYFEILLCALKYHMKKGGVLRGLFPVSFQERRFFDEIVVDPYVDYKEEIYLTSKGETFLLVTLSNIN